MPVGLFRVSRNKANGIKINKGVKNWASTAQDAVSPLLLKARKGIQNNPHAAEAIATASSG
jgi:hypothetical protein